MNCQGCGHNYPNTLTRCPRCKMLSGRRAPRASDSRLIEFPRKARPAEQTETTNTALPQWRQDLNEKVRAIQARRNNPAMASASPVRAEEAEIAAPQFDGRRKAHSDSPVLHDDHVSRIDALSHEAVATKAPARNANPIVEKALSRVRRASENARREYLPKIEPAKPVRPTYAVENEATARALEPTTDVSVKESPVTWPEKTPAPVEVKAKPTLDVSAVRTSAVKPMPVETSRTTKPLEPIPAASPVASPLASAAPVATSHPYPTVAQPMVEPVDSYGANDFDTGDFSNALTIDEIEPVDYLEAEIRKVDRALTAELHRDDRLSSLTHLFIGAIDLGVIALSALPFVALIGLYNGNFGLPQTRMASIIITLLIAFFYLALTQALCGRTFGMMMTNTRVIDVYTGETASAARAIIRTIGCFLAALPAFIGLLWGAFSPQRRGWQDYLAGTRIISDF
jgi:uncharacterized RDD family membrane protein YckC